MSNGCGFPPALLAQLQQDWSVQDYGRALARMEEHWRAAPRDPMLSLHYATILGHCSRDRDAKLLLDELVTSAAPGRRLWALGSAGVACVEFRRFDWAADFMREAAAEPNPPAEVFFRWSESLERLNRLPAAAQVVAEGQQRFPDHHGLALVAARLARRHGFIEEAERRARALIDTRAAPEQIRCDAGYELGHALDAQDRCAEAYEAFIAAKRLQQAHAATFEHAWRARVQHLLAPESLPAAEECRVWSASTPPRRHAFLVGCPRSGTTLLERMLGGHPEVVCSSESTVWRSAVWMPLLRSLGDAAGMRALLQRVSSEQTAEARSRYWRDIEQATGERIGERLLLDKNPSVFAVLAGAARVFPEARLLIALRDPRDIVWSCFTQALPVNLATAAFTRLESAAEQVAAEITHWLRLRPRLAAPWLEVSYEALVSEPAVQMRRALSFLGLPWSDGVLSFHERRDPVRSPTYAAVGQPVHDKSVGRWRRYAALFEPLKALDEVVQSLERRI